MIPTLLLAQVLLITPSAPPASPAEAARTLLAASPDLQVRPMFFGSILSMPIVVLAPRPRPAATTLPPYPPRVPFVHIGQSFTPVIDIRIINDRTPAGVSR
jgi:hypothetical protein